MNRPSRPPRRRVDGVLLLDKPTGITSNHALQQARRLFNAAKAGHTGTLDPMATGLLPLCFGEATKFAGVLLEADKGYEATVWLGRRTDTGDADGQLLETRPVGVTAEAVDAALARFRGDILQVPPMHSALKRDGRPFYEYARRGIELERAPRGVTIYALDRRGLAGDRLQIAVDCSKGTYVRTLAEDIGEALGCGAHLVALRRTRIGGLRADAAISLAALEALSPQERDARLQPPDALLAVLARLDLDAALTQRFCQGQAVPGGDALLPGPLRIYGADGRFLGLGRADPDGRVSPARLVATAVEK